jgi:hypothetical protein
MRLRSGKTTSFPVPVSILTEITVVYKSGRKTGECEDEWGRGNPRTSLPQEKVFFFHINQTYIPTAVYFGVVDCVILLKAFVGYTNV